MIAPALSRILYAEDDHDIQVVAQLALEAIGGYTVCLCSSGLEALRAIGVFMPDLILLDVMMPEMDGPDTLAALRAAPIFSSTPVVFMTAKVQRHEIDQYRAMGAITVIAKPFDPMSLSTEIAQIWSTYHARTLA